MKQARQPIATGGCQCGAIRYALFRRPPKAGLCSCRMCQKAVGGPFLAWANIPAADFAWTRGVPGTFQSSSAAERYFCPNCGTPLGFKYLKRPGVLSVTIGSLDAPHDVAIAEILGIEGRWPTLEPDRLAALPAYRTGQVSPPEDLSRIRVFQHPDHATSDSWNSNAG